MKQLGALLAQGNGFGVQRGQRIEFAQREVGLGDIGLNRQLQRAEQGFALLGAGTGGVDAAADAAEQVGLVGYRALW